MPFHRKSIRNNLDSENLNARIRRRSTTLRSTNKRRFALLFFLLAGVLGIASPLGIGIVGCATPPPGNPGLGVGAILEDSLNPLFVQTNNPDYLWESVVDVIDNYFPIAREDPIRKFEAKNDDGQTYSVFTEGRIDTDPTIASGFLEPWGKNSVDCSQRLEASFQTIRRSAVVRIVPDGSGFLVHLAVYNELENLKRPSNSNVDATNMTFSDDFKQIEYPKGSVSAEDGWIPDGRNFPLEQHILREIAWRVNNPPTILNSKTTNAPNVVP